MFYLHIKLGCPKIYSQYERVGGVRIAQTRNESVNDRKLLVFSTHTSHSPSQPTACFIDYLISWMSKGKITFISAQRRKAAVSAGKRERERTRERNEKRGMFSFVGIHLCKWLMNAVPDSIFSTNNAGCHLWSVQWGKQCLHTWPNTNTQPCICKAKLH